jgi:hypothetical protein
MMTPKDYSSAVCSYGKLPDIHYIYDALWGSKLGYFVSIEWATNLPLFQTLNGMCCSCVYIIIIIAKGLSHLIQCLTCVVHMFHIVSTKVLSCWILYLSWEGCCWLAIEETNDNY